MPNSRIYPSEMEIQDGDILIHLHLPSYRDGALRIVPLVPLGWRTPPFGSPKPLRDATTSIIPLADDLQTILGGNGYGHSYFPHKSILATTRGTVPRHLRPNSIRHYISNIRRWTKAIGRLVHLKANSPTNTLEDTSHMNSRCLWGVVSTH